MSKIYISIVFVVLILFTACSDEDSQINSVIADEEILEIETEYLEKEYAVNNLLKEFKSWEGKKEPGDILYTLNLNNDEYILTINPKNSSQAIDWVDMYYFQEEDIKTYEELAPMDKLASTISSYWVGNKQWIDKVIAGELPYEEQNDNYILTVDYYIYNDSKVGICLKISNTEEQTVRVIEVDSISDKRKKLASEIQDALNAPGHSEICTSVYFNNEGELIIEATSYWSNMNDSDKKDIIYLLEEILINRKDEINVDGYGQFFSPVGRGLEAFYAE